MVWLYGIAEREMREVSTRDLFVSYDMNTFCNAAGEKDTGSVENMIQMFEDRWEWGFVAAEGGHTSSSSRRAMPIPVLWATVFGSNREHRSSDTVK
jgi:hypothetical protein